MSQTKRRNTNNENENAGFQPQAFNVRGLAVRFLPPAVVLAALSGYLCWWLSGQQNIGPILEIFAACGPVFGTLLALPLFFGVFYLTYMYWVVVPNPRAIRKNLSESLGGIQKILQDSATNNEGENSLRVAKLAQHFQPLHPWLGYRLNAVYETYLEKGQAAARVHNQDLASRDEDSVASSLLWAQVCEWALPIVGFLGTVWGLHRAIPSLVTGVEQALNDGGMNADRDGQQIDTALSYFSQAFDYLGIAFDTTLVGLAGVLIVGLLLYNVRKLAVDSLLEVGDILDGELRNMVAHDQNTELQEIRRILKSGLMQENKKGPLLQAIVGAVEKGLLEKKGKKSRTPILNHLVDLVSTGLIHTPDDQDAGQATAQPEPLMPRVVQAATDRLDRAIRGHGGMMKEVHQYSRRRLEAILMKMLEEQEQQTFFESKVLAPDVRKILLQLQSGGEPGDSQLIPPSCGTVDSLPEEYQITDLALASGQNILSLTIFDGSNLYYLQEYFLKLESGSLDIHKGFKFAADVDQAGMDRRLEANMDQWNTRGLGYDPANNYLYFILIVGEVIRIKANRNAPETMENKEPVTLEWESWSLGIDSRSHQQLPLFWWDGSGLSPLLACWDDREKNGILHFSLYRLTETNQMDPLPLAAGLKGELPLYDSSESGQNPGTLVRLTVDQDGLFIVIPGWVHRLGWNEDQQLDILESWEPPCETIITMDVSVARGTLAVVDGDGVLHETSLSPGPWKCQPAVLDPKSGLTEIFYDASGRLLAAVQSAGIDVWDMDRLEKSGSFDLQGQKIAKVARSQDRAGLAVASRAPGQLQNIALFHFGVSLA